MKGKSVAEAAREIGVSRSTVRGWLEAKRFHVTNRGLVAKRGMDELRALAAVLAEENEEEEENDNLREALLRAQVRERRAIGRLRELELSHESGRFVELALVQRDAENAAEHVIAILRAIPQRTALALECACRKGALVEAKIRDEVERAIAEIFKSVYAGGPQ